MRKIHILNTILWLNSPNRVKSRVNKIIYTYHIKLHWSKLCWAHNVDSISNIKCILKWNYGWKSLFTIWCEIKDAKRKTQINLRCSLAIKENWVFKFKTASNITFRKLDQKMIMIQMNRLSFGGCIGNVMQQNHI